MELLKFVRDNPLLSKTDVVRSFPYDEEKTRLKRLRELKEASLVEVVDMDGRKGHRIHAIRITPLGEHVMELCLTLEQRIMEARFMEPVIAEPMRQDCS